MQHGRYLLIDRPGVAGSGCGVASQVEDEDVALPDALSLELLSDEDTFSQVRATLVGGQDGALEASDRKLVH